MFEPVNLKGTRPTPAAKKLDPPQNWSEVGQTNNT